MSNNERGNVIAIGVLSLFLVLSLAFGIWSFLGMQNYRNNVDRLVSERVQIEVDKAKTAKDAEFAQKEKEPLKTYIGPDALGAVSVSYPKTWSAYIDEAGRGNVPLKAIFHPNFVPVVESSNAYALKIEVRDSGYDTLLKQFESEVNSGKVTSEPFRLEKLTDVLGVKLSGQIDSRHQGVMILLPLRDKTLAVWTESNDFVNDFNTLILSNLTFRP